MKSSLRDSLLFLLGLAAGYVVAVITRAGNVPFLDPARQYVVTHQTESFVGLILVGLIVYLAGGKSGKR